MEEKQTTVMTFGVFDNLHDGHRHFLREAKGFGDKLITVVAQDKIVFNLKGKTPKQTLGARIKKIKMECLSDLIVAGDEKFEKWDVVLKYKPSVIALGFDQQKLANALETFIKDTGLEIKLKFVSPFKDGSLHSSKL